MIYTKPASKLTVALQKHRQRRIEAWLPNDHSGAKLQAQSSHYADCTGPAQETGTVLLHQLLRALFTRSIGMHIMPWPKRRCVPQDCGAWHCKLLQRISTLYLTKPRVDAGLMGRGPRLLRGSYE